MLFVPLGAMLPPELIEQLNNMPKEPVKKPKEIMESLTKKYRWMRFKEKER